METETIFPKSNRTLKERKKKFCFADVQRSGLWDDYGKKKIGGRRARELDKIISNIILK